MLLLLFLPMKLLLRLLLLILLLLLLLLLPLVVSDLHARCSTYYKGLLTPTVSAGGCKQRIQFDIC